MLSHVWLFSTTWTVIHKAPLSMGFLRQEYWSGLPFPFPGDLLDPGIRSNPHLHCRWILYHWATREAHYITWARFKFKVKFPDLSKAAKYPEPLSQLRARMYRTEKAKETKHRGWLKRNASYLYYHTVKIHHLYWTVSWVLFKIGQNSEGSKMEKQIQITWIWAKSVNILTNNSQAL